MNQNDIYDVVVCGGGIAGISAALAAQRSGAKTLLIEKEYALGGLATLGLIVVYLPLCDGDGVQMTGGIAEELLKLSLKYAPPLESMNWCISEAWRNTHSTQEDRSKDRYAVTYHAASLMIAAEELLLGEGVTIYYDARLSGVKRDNGVIESLIVETKTGKREFGAKAFIDATGDADICYFAGEETVDNDTNRRTGWYFSFDGNKLKLHEQTDPIYSDVPVSSRLYGGTSLEDISQHCIDGRKMIVSHFTKLQESNKAVFPLIIPTFPGLRMTRRLSATFEFSEDLHERVWFSDAIGMIGNWKHKSLRYSIPYRAIKAVKNNNLYVVGRCVSADESGWDLTRVIPTCALTGEASGIAAAYQALESEEINIKALQKKLQSSGVLLDASLFNKTE